VRLLKRRQTQAKFPADKSNEAKNVLLIKSQSHS